MREHFFWGIEPSSDFQSLASIGESFNSAAVANSSHNGSCTYDVHEVLLNGKLQLAVADNQASANIMSLKFAIDEGMSMETVRVPFTFADGSERLSAGRVAVDCALRCSPHVPRAYEFYIFPDLIEPLILGRKLLHDAGISRYLKRHNRQPLLDDDNADAQSVWTTRSLDQIEYCRWQIRVALRHGNKIEEIAVVPDGGSDINAMSYSYARAIGIHINLPRRQDFIRLADGRGVRVLGFVRALIHFHGKAGDLGEFSTRFLLIDGLPFHAAFGRPIIERYRIFGHMQDFDWTPVDDDRALLCMMGWNKHFFKEKHRQPQQADFTSDPTYQSANDTAIHVAQSEENDRNAALQASRNVSAAQTPARAVTPQPPAQ